MIELDVPERLLLGLHEGQSASFTLAADPSRSFSTTVERIVPIMDTLSRTTKVRLKAIPLPARTTLDALVFAEIASGVETSLLLVPTTAFVFYQNRHYLIKKAIGGSSAVPVEIVEESETVSSIRAVTPNSLHEGDQIAVKGAIFLFNPIMSKEPGVTGP